LKVLLAVAFTACLSALAFSFMPANVNHVNTNAKTESFGDNKKRLFNGLEGEKPFLSAK